MQLESVGLAGRLAEALAVSWRSIARPEQIEPAGDWTIWVYLAGRGSGKTRSSAEWVRELVASGRARRIALVAPTAADARDVMVEGESGILATAANYNRPLYEPSKSRLTWPNGAIATMFSSEEPDRLRGPQHDAAVCDELAAWRNAQSTWDMLQFGMRLGKSPRCMITTTPRPIKLLKALAKRDARDVVITRGRTSDNAANLSPMFMSQIVSRYEGTRLARQELEGEILEDIEGSLWSRERIDDLRIENGAIPPLTRIVVAIDPAVSVGEDSDETGILVAGLGDDGHGYVLEDLSGKYSPAEWAQKAIGAYRRLRADRIVIEKNQGGDMAENTLRMIDPNMPIRTVHASRGKIVRAEPVSALYEQNKVHHVGAFPMLEDQMCTFEAGSTDSPDRVDALVYAISDLQVQRGNDGIIEWTRRLVERLKNPAIVDRGELVMMRAPLGVSQLSLVDGSRAEISPAGTVMVPKDIVGGLRLAGFEDIAS